MLGVLLIALRQTTLTYQACMRMSVLYSNNDLNLVTYWSNNGNNLLTSLNFDTSSKSQSKSIKTTAWLTSTQTNSTKVCE